MPLSKNKKLILSFLTFSLFFLVGLGGYLHYQTHYKIIWKHQEQREKEYSEIEESFIKNPNIRDAGILMDFYHGEKNYEKALYFGKQCIKLGADDTPIAFSVHYQLASIYKEIGNIDIARKHLKDALRLDKDKRIIKNNWLVRDKLTDLLSEDELKTITKG